MYLITFLNLEDREMYNTIAETNRDLTLLFTKQGIEIVSVKRMNNYVNINDLLTSSIPEDLEFGNS